MGIGPILIKQACLLPETMMALRPPPPSTPTYLYKPYTVLSARLLTADKLIKKKKKKKNSPTEAPEKFVPVSACWGLPRYDWAWTL